MTLAGILQLVGLFCVLRAFYALLTILRIHFVKLDSSWASRFGSNPWAVVTGCTGGIGKEFCYLLAQLGFNIVMLARNQSAMMEISADIERKFKVQIKQYIVDFQKASYEDFLGVQALVKDVNFRLLVNNVGFASMSPFSSQSPAEINNQIKVNAHTVTHLTHILLPRLLECQAKDNSPAMKSAIVNMSSISIEAAFSTTPVYIATKAYDDLFTRALAVDVGDKVEMVSVRASLVKTPATKYSQQIIACSAEDCASGALKALGVVEVTRGHITHNLQSFLIGWVGEPILRFLLQGICRNVTKQIKTKRS